MHIAGALSLFKNKQRYWLEDNSKISIKENTVKITNYPFPGINIFPSGSLVPSDIDAIDFGFSPTLIILKNNNVVFASKKASDNLRTFAAAHHVNIVSGQDIWNFILDPFHRIASNPETKEDVKRQLVKFNIEWKEVMDIRKRVAPVMWCYPLSSSGHLLIKDHKLGFYDLCIAHMAHLGDSKFPEFFEWAKVITEKYANR